MRVQLGDAVAGCNLQAHSLFGRDQERSLLFARFAEQQFGHRPAVGSPDARPGQADGQLLLTFGLAAQVQSDYAPRVGLQLCPVTQRRATNRLDLQPGGQQKAQAENAGPRDVRRGVRGQNNAVFAERKGVLRLDAHVRLDGGRLHESAGLGVRIPEGAAHRESRNLRLERLRHCAGEILEVDGRKRVGAHGVELHFIAGGNAKQTDLSRCVIHRDQPDRMLERQRPGGGL